jgi:hypothetical protein
MQLTTFLASTLLVASTALAAPTVAPKKVTRAFLTNCWTDPVDGARSEVDFFAAYPSNFGTATPDTVGIASDGVNYEWESNGSVAIGKDTFTWNFPAGEGTKDQPAGAEVGTASLAKAGTQFTIVKESQQTLYTDGDYNCVVIYGAIEVPN